MITIDCKSCGAPPRQNALRCDYCGRVASFVEPQRRAITRQAALASQEFALIQAPHIAIVSKPTSFWGSVLRGGFNVANALMQSPRIFK